MDAPLQVQFLHPSLPCRIGGMKLLEHLPLIVRLLWLVAVFQGVILLVWIAALILG